LLSDEGKRIVLPAFFQRGRDFPDETRQTFATAHASDRHTAFSTCRPFRGPIRFSAATSCAYLNGCHPRPVNAYLSVRSVVHFLPEFLTGCLRARRGPAE